ncbi:hypothetical protein PYCCODRAFT_1367630 [Trametes coccinea BRFM310]|uniref:Uncharacterized protein n=1 Tax=Trametes coccinea (strain BRFM310) TaxID=1353009 RepID=A0A1Y2IN11_TRAC3|nr:hypothetical protein PYCCODRAFT_1367630 [Trametes coccinea BRFM310]
MTKQHTGVSRTALLVLASVFAGSTIASQSCPAGSYSSNGQTPCTQCSPGTYQQNQGQTSCQSAQAGWYATGPGATSQSICQQGTYSTGGAASCTPCPAGSYCNGQGQTHPVLCPKGHYSPTPGLGQQCLECPKGTFVAVEGATACCSCCSGFYNDQTSQDHCFNCPVSGASSPAGATSKDQCSSTSNGGLTTCSMSGNTCPNTGGSFPSGTVTRRRPTRRQICPSDQRSCPVYGSRTLGAGFLKGHECVDVLRDLERCGGCVAPDESLSGERSADGGRDCSAIPYVDSVTCRKGECVIGRCAPGYVVSTDGERCVASFNVQG